MQELHRLRETVVRDRSALSNQLRDLPWKVWHDHQYSKKNCEFFIAPSLTVNCGFISCQS